MKRAYILLAALVLAAGCGDSDTAPAADDNREQYTATLLTANEVPPIPNAAEAGASGMAHIDFNLTKDAAGAITAANIHFRVDLTGFPATSAITAAHIHTGAAGAMGPVLVNTTVTPGQVTLSGGVGTFSATHHRGGSGRRPVDHQQPGRLLLQRPHVGEPAVVSSVVNWCQSSGLVR